MQADQVGAGQQVIQFDLLDPDLHRPLWREERIVGDHLHAQAQGAVGDDRADVAAADDAERLARQLHAHEAVLLPLAGLGGEVRLGQLARQGEHHGDGVLGGGDRVAERSVHHHHARLGGGRDVDVVDPDAGSTDHLQLLGGGQHILVDLGGRADGETVVVADDLEQLVLGKTGLGVGLYAALLEDLDGGGREFVCDENAGHGFCLVMLG